MPRKPATASIEGIMTEALIKKVSADTGFPVTTVRKVLELYGKFIFSKVADNNDYDKIRLFELGTFSPVFKFRRGMTYYQGICRTQPPSKKKIKNEACKN